MFWPFPFSKRAVRYARRNIHHPFLQPQRVFQLIMRAILEHVEPVHQPPERPGHAGVACSDRAAQRLRRVFHHRDTVVIAERHDLLNPAGMAEGVRMGTQAANQACSVHSASVSSHRLSASGKVSPSVRTFQSGQ